MDNDKENILKGKTILAVDDEQDVLETVKDLLPMCKITTASTHEEAWELIGTNYYDFVILDIMGVDGYRLLSLANERGLTAVMLTAHALSPENLKKSYDQGAALYIPKDELINIQQYLVDVLEAKEAKKSTWWRWRQRFEAFFGARFDVDWNEFDKKYF
jgi:CheY-like chemotaxis protein